MQTFNVIFLSIKMNIDQILSWSYRISKYEIFKLSIDYRYIKFNLKLIEADIVLNNNEWYHYLSLEMSKVCYHEVLGTWCDSQCIYELLRKFTDFLSSMYVH